MKRILAGLLLALSALASFEASAGSLYIEKWKQLETSSGTPCAGCKLYFYTTGTTTPKDTFSDEALATANANPITLNSAGRVAAAVWISGRYRVVFKTAAGVTISDDDPVEDLAAASDIQDGTPNYCGTNSGTANALAFTCTPTFTSYTAGIVLRGRITADNSSTVTVNFNGVGAKSVVKRDGTALASGDLQGPDLLELAYDSTSDVFRALNASSVVTTGRLSAVRTYTANDTWTKPTGVDFIIVEALGGGGGGGGADVDAGPGSGCGAGGGAGGYAREKIAAASLGATETVTIGALGAAGAAGNNAGSNGGNTTFGAHVTANGGTGGGSMPAAGSVQRVAGGAGGTASGGDINITGQNGGDCLRNANTFQLGGRGADSIIYGTGGAEIWGVSSLTGRAGTGYGSGGGGAAADDGGVDSAGGAGTVGIVVVYEYVQ